MTLKVPFEVNDDVAVRDPKVAVPPVREEIMPVTALNNVAKRLEEVALILVRLVTSPVVEKRLVTVPTVVLEVLRTVLPETVRAVAEALANVV